MDDNQKISSKSTPDTERRKLGLGDIWSNSVKCFECDEVIRSRHRYDFVRCSCGSVAIDGVTLYPKIIGNLDKIRLFYEHYDDAQFED